MTIVRYTPYTSRMEKPMPPRTRAHARTAGILYLVTHVTSVAALPAYAAGLLAAGVTLEFLLAVGCLGTGLLLWVLLREYGPARATTFALMRAVEASVILAGTLPMVAAMWLGDSGTVPIDLLTSLHTASFLVGQGLVISVNTVVLGWLLWDSRLVPRALAGLGVVGGVAVLLSNLAQLWSVIPLNGAVAAVAAVPVFAFEIWLAIRLIAVGLRPSGSARTVSPQTAAA